MLPFSEVLMVKLLAIALYCTNYAPINTLFYAADKGISDRGTALAVRTNDSDRCAVSSVGVLESPDFFRRPNSLTYVVIVKA